MNLAIDNLNREIQKLNVKVETLNTEYASVFNAEDSEKIIGYELIIAELISSYKEFTSYWSEFCRTYKETEESDDETLQQMDKKYNLLIKKMIEIIKFLDITNRNLNCLADGIGQLDSSNKDILKTIDEASSSIVYKRATKVKGENNPNTKRGIKTEDLVHDYIAAGCVLSNEVVAKYNAIEPVTYHGLRKRLVDAGVWQNKHRR